MPEPLAVELYERVGERIRRTGLLVYGLVRQAVRVGYAGLWATHDEIGALIGGSGSAVKRSLVQLVGLGLVLQVAISVEREDAPGRQRVANAYTLGTEGKAAAPRRARWNDRPPRAQGSRGRKGCAGRNGKGEGAERGSPGEGQGVSPPPPQGKTPSLLLSDQTRAASRSGSGPRRDDRAARAPSSPDATAAASSSPSSTSAVSGSAGRRSGESGDSPSNAACGGGSRGSESTIRTNDGRPGGGFALGDVARCSPEAAALLSGRVKAGGPAAATSAPARPQTRDEARVAAALAMQRGADLSDAIAECDPDVVATTPWARGVMQRPRGAS